MAGSLTVAPITAAVPVMSNGNQHALSCLLRWVPAPGGPVVRSCVYRSRIRCAGDLVSQVFPAFASSPCAEIFFTFSLGWLAACLALQSRAGETLKNPLTCWSGREASHQRLEEEGPTGCAGGFPGILVVLLNGMTLRNIQIPSTL